MCVFGCRVSSSAAGAMTSWRHIQDEGLAQAMVQLLRYLHDGIGAEAWGRLVHSLEPAVRSKLESMCR
jgi:hypothetical protein